MEPLLTSFRVTRLWWDGPDLFIEEENGNVWRLKDAQMVEHKVTDGDPLVVEDIEMKFEPLQIEGMEAMSAETTPPASPDGGEEAMTPEDVKQLRNIADVNGEVAGVQVVRILDALEAAWKERDDVVSMAIDTITSSFCDEHTKHVRSISGREYIEERRGKCEHCIEKERDEARAAHERCKAVLREAVARVDAHSGCGDNSCLFQKPTGMATNGGCRCLGRAGEQMPGLAWAIKNLFHAARGVLTDDLREQAEEAMGNDDHEEKEDTHPHDRSGAGVALPQDQARKKRKQHL